MLYKNEYKTTLALDTEFVCQDALCNHRNIYVYKKTIQIFDGKNLLDTKVTTGLCSEDKIPELKSILKIGTGFDFSKEGYYYLVDKEFLSTMRTENYLDSQLRKYTPENPYDSYLLNKEKYTVINFNYDCFSVVRDVTTGKYLPRLIILEPTDGVFNLSAIKDMIEYNQNFDIKTTAFRNCMKPISSHFKTATSGDYEMEIYWSPTQSEWDNVVKEVGPRAENKNAIMKKVLHFPETNEIFLEEDDLKKVLNNMTEFINNLDIDETICKHTDCPLDEFDENKEHCKKCIINHFLNK